MSFSIEDLRNPPVISAMVVYLYLCETWKMDRPHTISILNGKAKLIHHSDELLYEMQTARWEEQYLEKHKSSLPFRTYNKYLRQVKAYKYDVLKNIYKVTMHPKLNPFGEE